MKRILIVLLAASAGWARAGSGEDHSHAARKAPAAFEKLKALEGAWKGISEMNGKPETVTVTYRVTSAGTAVVETLGPGTPHEMVTIYHAGGGEVEVTHYCAMGNQPRLKLLKADGGKLVFDFTSGSGIDPAKDPHMHSLSLLIGDGTLEQRWTDWKDGKANETMVLQFKKEKPAKQEKPSKG